ncbi:MAG: DNA alkylation repair protein [Promethearchaeota archaeon]|nr:MAG: DNA alkylation repair protein [Candidatus Lokiarchaeota archaeon]
MNLTKETIADIKAELDKLKPSLSEDKKNRMYKIINPDIDAYVIFGIKTADIEKVIREVQSRFTPSFNQAKEIFKSLVKINNEEYKFAAFFLLNRYKIQFDEKIPVFFRDEYFPFCHTWSSCDSCCIRVIGPYLAKKQKHELAINTIDSWSKDDSIWIKRASMVIHLKIIMLQKDFDEEYVFNKLDNMLEYSNENYIEKGIGWLLKTCSKYKPNIISDYLYENRKKFSRLILRYASEKLPKQRRDAILQK